MRRQKLAEIAEKKEVGRWSPKNEDGIINITTEKLVLSFLIIRDIENLI